MPIEQASPIPRITESPQFLMMVNRSVTKPMQAWCQTATEPEIEPAVAGRSRRCQARRLFHRWAR
jgi:hypothetical protein